VHRPGGPGPAEAAALNPGVLADDGYSSASAVYPPRPVRRWRMERAGWPPGRQPQQATRFPLAGQRIQQDLPQAYPGATTPGKAFPIYAPPNSHVGRSAHSRRLSSGLPGMVQPSSQRWSGEGTSRGRPLHRLVAPLRLPEQFPREALNRVVAALYLLHQRRMSKALPTALCPRAADRTRPNAARRVGKTVSFRGSSSSGRHAGVRLNPASLHIWCCSHPNLAKGTRDRAGARSLGLRLDVFVHRAGSGPTSGFQISD
jgi:hypothetical protein